MRALKRLADLLGGVLRGLHADLRSCASAQPCLAKRNHDVGAGAVERLPVGVGGNKGNAARLPVNHVFDCVSPAAANAKDLDNGHERFGVIINHLDGHSET